MSKIRFIIPRKTPQLTIEERIRVLETAKTEMENEINLTKIKMTQLQTDVSSIKQTTEEAIKQP